MGAWVWDVELLVLVLGYRMVGAWVHVSCSIALEGGLQATQSTPSTPYSDRSSASAPSPGTVPCWPPHLHLPLSPAGPLRTPT